MGIKFLINNWLNFKDMDLYLLVFNVTKRTLVLLQYSTQIDTKSASDNFA